MAKASPVAGVQGALLKWARESAHVSIEHVAKKLKRPVQEIEAWEAGTASPSYAQLEKLAYDLYKRPLAIFFLPDVPPEPKPEAEFRALPEADLRQLRRDTIFLIRRARAYQDSLIELFNGRSPVQQPIWKRVKLEIGRAVAPQGRAVRLALGVPEPGADWGSSDGDAALKIWRKAVEGGGIFVFKDSFKQREISGFCLDHPELPVVMINNGVTKTRQTFSLIHELAHILMGRRAISTFSDETLERLPPAESRIERFCNQIAAEVLVPTDDFTAQTADLPKKVEEFEDDLFATLAARYRVSREVILRRFRDAERVSQRFYEIRKRKWDAQTARRGSGGNFYATKGAYLSERLMQEVFHRYSRRQITVDEAADFIGVKPKQVDELENRFLRGAAS